MDGVEKEVFKPIGDDGEKKDKLSILEEELKKLRAEKDAERAELHLELDSLKNLKSHQGRHPRQEYLLKILTEDGFVSTQDICAEFGVMRATACADFRDFSRKNQGVGYILLANCGTRPFRIKKTSIRREQIYNFLRAKDSPFATTTAQLCADLNLPVNTDNKNELSPINEDIDKMASLLSETDIDHNYIATKDESKNTMLIEKETKRVRG